MSDDDGCETIFLKPVNNGYLITNIVGDNGNLSFKNFQSIINDSDEDMVFNNDLYYDNEINYHGSNGRVYPPNIFNIDRGQSGNSGIHLIM